MRKELQSNSLQQKRDDLVIFDFDGTLADSSEAFIEAFDQAAQREGAVPYKRQEAARLRQLDALEVLRDHGVEPNRISRFAEHVRLELGSHAAEIHLFPEVLSTLWDLMSAGHTLALVTSNSRDNVTAIFGEEFSQLFSIGCFDIPIAGKEETLQRLAEGRKVDRSAVFYVGDELRDLHAATVVGINFIGVSWGFNTAESLRRAGCSVIIDHLSELPSLLSVQRKEDLIQHLNALYGYAMVLSRNSASAADLVQETYLRAIAAKDRLWENSAVKSWLFTILRNIWLNQVRKDKSEQQFVISDGDERTRQSANDSPEPSLDPGAAYEQKVAREMIRAALAQLPEDFREIIVLREFEDLPYQEIAKILNCPPGTVMSRLARARAKLRTILVASQGAGTYSNQMNNEGGSLVGR